MGGYMIPPPGSPKDHPEWWAGLAARQAAGLSVLVGDDYVNDGRPAPDGTVWRYLDRAEIGAWFGVSGDAVRKWQQRYAAPDSGYRPFPGPDVIMGRSPGWSPHRETEIWAWKKGMPGRGAGGGRPPKSQPE